MAWLVGAIFVLLALDVAFTLTIRRLASARLSERLGSPAVVHTRGWPASVRFPLGRLAEVTIDADDVTVGGTHVAHLRVVLHRVAPTRTPDGRWSLTTSGGSFRAHLDTPAVRELTPFPSGVADVALQPGRVRFRLPGGVGVDAAVEVADGAVILRPGSDVAGLASILRVAFPLEGLPFGAAITDVEVRDGALLVCGRVGALTLP